jgi:acyl-coenzyme A synthetase/AMP-(fatty) acid ligase
MPPCVARPRVRHYRFVDALPKNNYGKLKTELRLLLTNSPDCGAGGE